MNPNTATLWSALRQAANFQDTFYDNNILESLQTILQVDAQADIHAAIQKFPPEIVLDAFFHVMAPFTTMYSDILNLYARCGANQSSENITIKFDISKSRCIHFKINHFIRAQLKLKEVEELQDQMVLTPDIIQKLWGLRGGDVHSTFFALWESAYFNNLDSWPTENLDFTSIVSCSPIREGLLNAFRLWQALFAFYRSTGIKRSEWFSKISKANNVDLLMPETDYCLLSILKSLYYLAESFSMLSPDKQQEIYSVLDSLSGQADFHKALVKNLKAVWEEFLTLPVWKHRYEVYSVWIFTQIVMKIPDSCIKFHISKEILAFPFSGACLATATLNEVSFDIWTELRTVAVVAPVGKGRKGAIQPDYSVVCGLPENVLDSIMVIECKQYKNASKRNFSQALIDYTNNRPTALVILADYGKVNVDSIVAGLKHIPEFRYKLFPECQPNSARSAQLSDSVFQTMMSKANLFQFDKNGVAVFSLYWCMGHNSLNQDLDLYLFYTDNRLYQSHELSYKKCEIDGSQYSGDIRHAPGLEQIVIQDFHDGVYDLWVNNFSSKSFFQQGKPVVVVSLPFMAESIKVEMPDCGNFEWWHILQIDSANNIIRIINKFVDASPS